MKGKKPCSGKIYIVKRKKWCVGEKKSSKTMNKRKRNKKSRKSRKNGKKVFKKGGNGDDKINCCVCGMEVNINDTLIPLDCLQKRREKGKGPHRLCQHCWWNPDTGFAREGINHKCPCCEKGAPFPTIKLKESTEVIDLTGDDD
jgi:hypothetical protein